MKIKSNTVFPLRRPGALIKFAKFFGGCSFQGGAFLGCSLSFFQFSEGVHSRGRCFEGRWSFEEIFPLFMTLGFEKEMAWPSGQVLRLMTGRSWVRNTSGAISTRLRLTQLSILPRSVNEYPRYSFQNISLVAQAAGPNRPAIINNDYVLAC